MRPSLEDELACRSQHEKRVAICGFAESWKQTPWDDQGLKVWGLNELWKYVPRWDTWFEIHDADTLGVTKRDLSEGEVKRHLEWLAKDHGEGKRIFMQKELCGDQPNAVPFPLPELINEFGPYFTSTIGMMIALAIYEGYTWIGLFGIDLVSDNDEYANQRPNAEYFTGLARGMDRVVYVPKESAMCKAATIYGYQKKLGEDGGVIKAIQSHKSTLTEKHNKLLAEINTIEGAVQECDNVLKLFAYKERGAPVETY